MAAFLASTSCFTLKSTRIKKASHFSCPRNGRQFKRAGLSPQARFSTWDDYAIMSMVESGLGLSILPGLILTRCPYAIEKRPLEPAVHRELAAVYRPGLLSSAARAFLDCL